MKSVHYGVFAAILLFFSGCVSYSYTGEKAEAKAGEVEVFTDSAKIGKAYQILGKAMVSGSYRQVSRDRMIEKLRNEAKRCGADAVLIVEQQVLPADLIRTGRKSGFFTAFDYDDTNRSWGELYRDVDVTIGNIGKESGGGSSGVGDYKRIIRAEFLRYTAGVAVPEK